MMEPSTSKSDKNEGFEQGHFRLWWSPSTSGDGDPSKQKKARLDQVPSLPQRPPPTSPSSAPSPSSPLSAHSPPSPSPSSSSTNSHVGFHCRRRRLKAISFGASVMVGLGVAATVAWVTVERTKPVRKAYIQDVKDSKYSVSQGNKKYSTDVCGSGKTLAMPKTEEEAGREFKPFLNQNKAKIKFSDNVYWAYIGLDDRGSDGTFKWVDGSGFSPNSLGSPSGNTGDADCVVTDLKGGSWKLKAISCESELPSVCQTKASSATTSKPKSTTTTTTTTTPRPTTPPPDDSWYTVVAVVVVLAMGAGFYWRKKKKQQKEQRRREAETAKALKLAAEKKKKEKEAKEKRKREEDDDEEPIDVVSYLMSFAGLEESPSTSSTRSKGSKRSKDRDDYDDDGDDTGEDDEDDDIPKRSKRAKKSERSKRTKKSERSKRSKRHDKSKKTKRYEKSKRTKRSKHRHDDDDDDDDDDGDDEDYE